jgi:hypothetical protein
MKGILIAVLFTFVVTGICFAAPDQPDMIGTYINKKDSKEYITFSAGGSFYLKQRTTPFDPNKPFMEVNGKYEKNGDTITLKLPDGGEASGTMKGSTFEDSGGASWVKEGSEEKKVERPKRMKF